MGCHRRGRYCRGHRRCQPSRPHGCNRGCNRHRRGPSPSPSPSRSPAPKPVVRPPGFLRGNLVTFNSLFGGRSPTGWTGLVTNVHNYGYMRDPETDSDTDSSEDEEPTPTPTPSSSGSRRRVRQPEPEMQEVLHVESVDFLVADNVKQHHTDEFDITEFGRRKLVVRRGQPFNIVLTFNRQYDTAKDDLRLVFEVGPNPKPTKNTHIEFILSDVDKPKEWGAKILKQSGKTITVTIFTPPDCIVSVWRFKVDVIKKEHGNATIYRYNHRDPIYMLFNPWNKDDEVYLEDDRLRQAYIMEDMGKLYCGNYKNISLRPWNFGQFDGNVLDCCMYLLDLSELNYAVRHSPVFVSRKLTAMVNANDDGGVLVGRWDGKYGEGKSPLSWTGSAPILEQYFREKFSVAFGQCWVFSGVLTTILRALGIPARSVTNFASAHDRDVSITIDMHFDEDGKPLDDLNEDSVWNFHVWNEAWMARPDLPKGYGGWQALDSTPQETSDNCFCCGPCPVLAIKEGEVNLPYDGAFIFAEVNADKVYWMIMKDGRYEKAYLEKGSIGKNISTMSVYGDREDVTNLYKHAEDTPQERAAVLKANKVGAAKTARDAYKEGPSDVHFDLEYDADRTFVGDDFVVTLACHNKSREQRHIAGQIYASTMYYTGVVADPVGSEPFKDVRLKPGETKRMELKVAPQDYCRKLKDCCQLSVSAMARVKETNQVFTKKDDMRVRKPHLTIKAPDQVHKGQDFEMTVSFVNPMPYTLTDCTLEIEAPGISKAQQHPQTDVPSKGTFTATVKLRGWKKGKRHIVAIFSSKQLEDINASHDIHIK